MLCNVIIFLIILILVEIIKTNNNIKLLSLNYTNLLICVIYSCFLLNLELFGITILLVYSSVFLILILFSFIFNYRGFKNKNNLNISIHLIIFLALFTSLVFYKTQKNLILYSWLSPHYMLILKNTQFINIIHIIIVKLFQIEVLILNYYLLIGLISSILIILKILNKSFNFKIMSFNKNKRLLRRTNSFNFKINNKRR